MVWQEFKEIFFKSIKEYLNSWKNLINSSTNILYVLSFGLKFYTMIVVSLKKSKVQDQRYWENLISSNCTDESLLIDAYDTIYWLNSSMVFYF